MKHNDTKSTERTGERSDPVPFLQVVLPPHSTQPDRYSLMQLEVLSGIALKRATRSLSLASSWAA